MTARGLGPIQCYFQYSLRPLDRRAVALAFIILFLITMVSSGILLGPLLHGYFKALEKEERGEKAEIGDLFSCLDRFLPSFRVVLFIFALGSMIGFVGHLLGRGALLTVTVLVVPIFPASITAAYQGENDVVAAIKCGWTALKPNYLMAVATSSSYPSRVRWDLLPLWGLSLRGRSR